jgi:preprotein translocase subunit SecE
VDLPLLIGAAVAVAAAGALVVWREPAAGFARRSAIFVQDVRAEVRKVTWPSWEDLRKSTAVIIAIIIVLGIVIGLMDFLFSWLLIDLLGRLFA